MDAAYQSIRLEAEALAGAPGDIEQRAVFHHALYRKSKGNHAFPLVALHGALWARGFFETSGKLGEAIRHRYFYDAEERDFRMGLLDRFAEGFKAVNRAVFVDTWTNYHFSEAYGLEPGADAYVHPELLAPLNTAHAVTARGMQLSADERARLFGMALRWEQEVTVAPGVQEELARFDCPVLRRLCLSPVVRFAYFPRLKHFVFRNFGDTEERIDKAVASYRLAEDAGWPRVEDTMAAYEALPPAYFANPDAYAERLRADLVGGSAGP